MSYWFVTLFSCCNHAKISSSILEQGSTRNQLWYKLKFSSMQLLHKWGCESATNNISVKSIHLIGATRPNMNWDSWKHIYICPIDWGMQYEPIKKNWAERGKIMHIMIQKKTSRFLQLVLSMNNNLSCAHFFCLLLCTRYLQVALNLHVISVMQHSWQ